MRPEGISSMADVEQAARPANAHDFILTLPKGYDTVSRAHESMHNCPLASIRCSGCATH